MALLKVLFKGILLGVGIVIGIAAVGIALMYVGAHKIEAATQRATEGLVRANAAIEREFPAPAADPFGSYRECLYANDIGNVAATIDACRIEFQVWQSSPTFSDELGSLQQFDARAAAIMAEYENANPTKYFD